MALITKIKTVYSEVIAALGFTPENSANKGQPNGYAGLDAGGRVPSAQLPSYVDDVQEYANLAAFPNPGQAGIIYLALDTNIIYRWSGSTYIEIASGEVAWADVTGKPAFGTMSLQDANNVNITGGTSTVTTSVIGNLTIATNEITSTEASDDILITPTGIGALKVQNRITLEDRLSFGPTDPQGSYFANNAEYLQSGFLSAWQYIQNGTATKVEFDNGGAMVISNAPSGNAGDFILAWDEVLNVSSSGDIVTGNWTAGVIAAEYGGTGLSNVGATLDITGNASISGVNTGDQTDITGNAGTATKLQTARTINGVAFDGTANITIATATPNNLTIASPLTGGSFNGSAPATIGLPTANSTVTGALSSTDWATFNTKQAALSGAGIVKSTNGTISYLTDNSSNWDTAYDRSLTSATVTGTTTKTLTLNQQGGTNITASWSDLNTDAVTSVFGRTGAVVATEGDYSLTQLSDVNLTSPTNGQLLQNNGTQWVNWTPNYLTSNQVVTLSGDVTGSGSTAITATLANTTVTAGTYGNATQAPQITIDSKGRATSATNVTITPAWASITSTPTTVAGYGITDGVTLTGTQTLTNKTVTDATFTIQDDVDNTKKAQFQASGITTATTRTYTLPNVNGTLVTTGDTGSVTNTMLAGSIADSKLNTISTAGKVENSATTATHANTANAIVARDANGDFAAADISLSGQLVSTRANNIQTGSSQIFLNGATGNRIDFNTNGVAAPTFTTRSVGTKILLYPAIGGTTVDYALGIAGNTLWQSIPSTTAKFSWYAGNTERASLSGAGAFTANTVISTKVGLGTITSPVNSLDTSGNILVNGEDTFIGIDAQTNARLGMIKEPGSGPKMAYSAFDDFIITQADTDDINPVNVATFTDRFKIDTTGKVGINQSASLTEQLEVVGNVAANRFLAIGAGSATTNEGQLFLNGAISNRIDFNANGLASPTTTTRSAGTKILFRNTISAGTLDYAIGMAADTFWFTGQNTATFFTYYTGSNVAARFGNVGASVRGPVYEGNSGITTQNTGVTLTIAQILTLVIQSTPTANITFTLPTGTLTDAGVLTSLENNRSFTWSVVNLATGFTITMAGATGMTYVGNTTIAASTSASFRTIKTATNTFTTYRI